MQSAHVTFGPFSSHHQPSSEHPCAERFAHTNPQAIFPEYVLFGKEDKLKLGHFVSAVDQRLDPPHERIHFLDYMAPEMLSVRLDENGNALPVAAVPGSCLAQVG